MAITKFYVVLEISILSILRVNLQEYVVDFVVVYGGREMVAPPGGHYKTLFCAGNKHTLFSELRCRSMLSIW